MEHRNDTEISVSHNILSTNLILNAFMTFIIIQLPRLQKHVCMHELQFIAETASTGPLLP